MAKILPAGANVNLGLGEDPMDRLLKTIQVASQAQGVMNQATLQRDRREAIQLETAQKLMTNQVLRMDAQNPVSIQETKNALLEFKNKFTKENPRLADDIDVFYGTAYNTEIKPIEDTHNRFNQIKDRLYLSLENINKNVQSLPNNTIIASDEMKFKNELGDLFGVLNDYKSNQAMFKQYLPDLNTGLYSDVVAANNLSTTLPKELKGLFDDVEQDLIVSLGKGEISLEYYNAARSKYFTASQGQVNSKIIPRISGEINSLWKDYQAPTAFKQAIASGKVPLQNDAIENQKNYYDETQGIYYYNGQQLNLGKFEDKTYNEDDPDTWLAAAKVNAEKTLQNVYLNDIKDKIIEKDALYKEYIQSATGEPSSYATQLIDSQKWPWQKGTSGGLIEDIKLDNNNAINETSGTETSGTETSGTETSESGQTYSSIIDFIAEYGDEAAMTTTIGVGAYNIPKVNKAIKSATSYITKTLDLPSDSVIDLFNDADFKQVSKQLSSVDKRILEFKKTLPKGANMDFKVGSKNFITYKALLQEKNQIVNNSKYAKKLITKMEAGYFPDLQVDKDNLPRFRKKVMNFLKESDKWDVNAIKRTVTKSLKQAYRTPKDLYNVLTQGAVKLGPLDAAIHAWFLMPEDAEIGYKVTAAGSAALGTKKIINYAKNKGISPFLNDKKLTSELGKFLIKKAPKTLAKIGFKGVAGAAAAGTGIGSAISAGMVAWTLNDIRKLVKQFPEIRQMLSESIARQESGELESGELEISNQEETRQPPVINEENWMQSYSQQGE
tara:strand:- start:6501 stop:8843 length:2343 start_codon:yes stop_codon:yes gene_type:complete